MEVSVEIGVENRYTAARTEARPKEKEVSKDGSSIGAVIYKFSNIRETVRLQEVQLEAS